MTLLDVKLTQGSYWKGAQLPYWVYMVVVVVLGGLGLDHLLLRSPFTFLLKLLIPTLGFWYLYDIAQVFGERESVEKYGLGVPWYGPIGLGAGIFINKDASNLSPPTIPKPWIFMAYAILSIVFFVFPLNKLVIGDYWGCIAHLGMYMGGLLTLGLTALLAVCWGVYDGYRVLFDTRGLFEKGAARVFPATWFGLDPLFNKGALGPEMGPVVKSDDDKGIISKIINSVIGVYTFGPRMALGAATSAAKLATDTAASTVKSVEDTIIQKGENVAGAVNSATGGLASKVVDKVGSKVGNIGGKVTNLVQAQADKIEEKIDTSINKAIDKGVGSVVNRITELPDKAATAVDALGKVATIEADAALAAVQTVTAATDIAKAGPKVLGKVADKLTDPAVQDAAVTSVIDNYLPAAAAGIMGKFIPTAPVPGTPAADAASAASAAASTAAAAAAVQKGGAILASSSDPAFSSAVLIFSVALLAFGGYVMYSFRKASDLNRNDRPDDSPPDAEPVRGSPKAKRA